MTEAVLSIRVKVSGAQPTADEIKRIEQAAQSAAQAMRRGNQAATLSAGELKNALRQVPMQFTDIVTGLASGQRPLTVLLQQGGQLKDVFGGIGPAVRALGGYVAGLINPATIAAGVIAGLGAAAWQGAEESQALNRALILSGNQAGVTSGQLNSYAAAAAQATGSTRGLAAEVVGNLAASGRLAGESLQKAAAAAIALARAGGPAADETVKAFAELGKSPLEAAKKLDDQTGFLTLAVYRQIKALQDQGLESEAARIAQAAYADEMGKRAVQLEANLGIVQRAWRAVGDTARAAWDAIVGIGRETSIDERIKELQGYAPHTGSIFTGRSADQEKELGLLLSRKKLAEEAAKAQADADEKKKAGIAWDALKERNLTKQAKLEKDIAEIRAKGAAAGSSAAEIEKVAAAAREKANPQRQSRIDPARIDLAQFEAQGKLIQRTLKDQLDDIDSLGKRQEISAADALARKYQAQLAALKDELALVGKELNVKGADPVKRQNLLGKRDELQAQQADLGKQYQRDQLELAAQARRDEASAWNALLDPIRNATSSLREQNDTRGMTVAQIAEEKLQQLQLSEALSGQQGIYSGLINAQQEYIGQLQRQRSAEENWRTGIQEAWQDYQERARNSAESAKTVVANSFKSMEDAVASFVTTGKLSFKSLASSIIAEMARAATNKAVSSLLGYVLGAFGGSSASNADFMSYGQNYEMNAKGAVHQSASLHQYTNQVVDRPTLFAFAQGGVFGEAGPEAVMPLTRTRDGNLGVRAQGGGGTVYNSTNITINTSNGQREQSGQGDERSGRLGQMLESAVLAIIVREQRPGGLLAAT
jgi:lambda family phage tail tape measure protein